MNEARRQRPNAPRLNLDTTVGSSAEEDGEEELDSDDSGMNDVCGCIEVGRCSGRFQEGQLWGYI